MTQTTLDGAPTGRGETGLCLTAGCGRKPRAGGKRCGPCGDCVLIGQRDARQHKIGARGVGAHYCSPGDPLTDTDLRLVRILTELNRPASGKELLWHLSQDWPTVYSRPDRGRISEALGRRVIVMVEKARIVAEQNADTEEWTWRRSTDKTGRLTDLYWLGPRLRELAPEYMLRGKPQVGASP